jgi:hypothetical protein
MARVDDLRVRRYDLDWLRVIAVLLLHLFHVGMFFVTWTWHVKNNYTSESLEYLMIFLHQWRMPLLLFISGAGTIYASSRRTSREFLVERRNRLFIPLIFSILVIVPPQIYFERIADYNSYLDFYPTVFKFVPYPMGGSLSWHHMWFVLYLFIYSIIALPMMNYLKSERSDRFLERLETYLAKKWAVLSFIIPIAVSQAILLPYFPDETHALIDDWAYFTFCFSFFAAGMLTASNQQIWLILLEKRRFHLIVALGSLLLLEFLFSVDWALIQPYITIDLMIIWKLTQITVTWAWVITFIGYGRYYLNKGSKLLHYANEGIYPFYILHQTVIITIAFPLTNWETSIAMKYLVIMLLSFMLTVLIYVLLIRPFDPLRFLFGMKSRHRTKPSKEQQTANEPAE